MVVCACVGCVHVRACGGLLTYVKAHLCLELGEVHFHLTDFGLFGRLIRIGLSRLQQKPKYKHHADQKNNTTLSTTHLRMVCAPSPVSVPPRFNFHLSFLFEGVEGVEESGGVKYLYLSLANHTRSGGSSLLLLAVFTATTYTHHKYKCAYPHICENTPTSEKLYLGSGTGTGDGGGDVVGGRRQQLALAGCLHTLRHRGRRLMQRLARGSK